MRSDLKGGRNGQLDAYRHALASATVSYTLGEWAVSLTTWVFESGGKDSNKMDIHNNRLGAKIGSSCTWFGDLEPAVRQAVLDGEASATDPAKITWLSPSKWRDGKFWQLIYRHTGEPLSADGGTGRTRRSKRKKRIAATFDH